MAFTFTDQNVNQIIESGKPVVIDFWATWCGPCMSMGPTIDALADEYADKVIICLLNKYEPSDE